jgi:YD repeat-containing protein
VVFNLPQQGSYRFRADYDGVEFWSGNKNTCTLPACTTAVTETSTTTPTATASATSTATATETPVPGNTSTATATATATNEATETETPTPEGTETGRLHDDRGVFKLARPMLDDPATETPTLTPESSLTPTATETAESSGPITIDYTYDALNRLTRAVYSNGLEFYYSYDAAGNVLAYTRVVDGVSSETSYTYDDANQLLTATEGETTWHYSYDSNGSLVMSSPSQGEANGATRNTYNKAGYLVKVEGHDGTAWQTQSEMRYDGLGNRLEMTSYNEGVGETIRYQLDNGQPLAAVGTESTSYYLYGRGVIGTKTDTWAYILQDGIGSTRQLATHEGVIAMSVAYTPWGDVLAYYGSGGIDFGYLGGIYDENTGLIYLGGGQYYDPVTGRMLTRGAGQSNPYKPGAFDPAGTMVAPLGLLGLVLGRKKKRGKWDTFIALLVVCVVVGMSVSACGPKVPAPTPPPHQPPTGTPSPGPGNGKNVSPETTNTPTPTPTYTCTVSPTATLTPLPTATPTPTSTPALDQFGVRFSGPWPENQKAIVLATVTIIGQKMSPYLGNAPSSETFSRVFGTPFEFVKTGGGDICYAGYKTVVCHLEADLTERFLTHEFGHVLQMSIDGVNVRQQSPEHLNQGPYYSLEKAEIRDSLGNWVTGTHPSGEFERTMRGYTDNRIPAVYHGSFEWDDWNSNVNHTARNEDFADMFLNWVFDSFDYSIKANDAGYKRYNWMQENMQEWVDLATR